MSTAHARKDDVIQIRASAEAKALIQRAAVLRGQKLSEFMLDSARQRAEDTLLDQRMFFLDAEAHAAFIAMLDHPAPIDPEAISRLTRKAPWQP
jgi:uncharacterized protein (DUF1778 family)